MLLLSFSLESPQESWQADSTSSPLSDTGVNEAEFLLSPDSFTLHSRLLLSEKRALFFLTEGRHSDSK